MEFPFPPPPPGYTVVVIARLLLGLWIVVGLVLVAIRIRRWTFIRPREMLYWIIAAVASGFVSTFGRCPFLSWDNNDFLIPLTALAISTSIVGIAIGLWKCSGEGYGTIIGRGFEIVVVGSVITGIVVVLLMGSVSRPRRAALRLLCMNNLRNIGVAMQNFHETYQSFPASTSGNEHVSWRVSILPYVDNASLFARYDQQASWDRPPNDQFAHIQDPVLTCPSSFFPKDEKGRWYTAYSMPTGPRTIGDRRTGTTIKDITDGTSNTLLVVEACGAQIVWTEPRDVDVGAQKTVINAPGTTSGNSAGWLSSYHRTGTNVLLADGSVRFLSEKTDPAVLRSLATIDGNEDAINYELP